MTIAIKPRFSQEKEAETLASLPKVDQDIYNYFKKYATIFPTLWMSQAAIAAAVGITRETVNRKITHLQDLGLMRRFNRGLMRTCIYYLWYMSSVMTQQNNIIQSLLEELNHTHIYNEQSLSYIEERSHQLEGERPWLFGDDDPPGIPIKGDEGYIWDDQALLRVIASQTNCGFCQMSDRLSPFCVCNPLETTQKLFGDIYGLPEGNWSNCELYVLLEIDYLMSKVTL